MTFKLTKALTRNDLQLYDPYDYEGYKGVVKRANEEIIDEQVL